LPRHRLIFPLLGVNGKILPIKLPIIKGRMALNASERQQTLARV